MYTKGETTYADAGCILISQTSKGYKLSKSLQDIREHNINLDDITVSDKFIKIDNILIANQKGFTYADWKKYIIKWRYSNDDQIAIILNKDNSEEDKMLFDKMQEWRDWAGQLAHILAELNK